ncbi:MAG: hypothetical protein H0U00_02135 [Actinobacteria bacterium]|nr:hypothetical protein [Actinomycetota bacterium]
MRIRLALLAPTARGGAPVPPVPVESLVVRTGSAPCGASVRAGSLWVGVYGTGTLLRLDGQSGRIETRVRVGSWPCRVAVGPKAVWFTRDRAGEVVRISLGSGLRERVRVGAGAFDVLLAGGSVWATSFDAGTVARIDPATGKISRLFRDGGSPAGLAACGGLVWIGHGKDTTWLTSIDPSTSRMRRVSVDAKSPGWPHCIHGEVWVTTPDSVLRLDARTGRGLSRLRIGETLAHAAAAPDGLVWVTDKQHSVVHRVHPTGRALVDSFPAGPGAFSLVRAGAAMWITSFAGSDARRFDDP